MARRHPRRSRERPGPVPVPEHNPLAEGDRLFRELREKHDRALMLRNIARHEGDDLAAAEMQLVAEAIAERLGPLAYELALACARVDEEVALRAGFGVLLR